MMIYVLLIIGLGLAFGCTSGEERAKHQRVTLVNGDVVDCHTLYLRRETVVCQYFARPSDWLDSSVTWTRAEVSKITSRRVMR